MSSRTNLSSESAEPDPVWLSIVREHVDGLRFGAVQIVVHEGRVTQVDATLRTRIAADDDSALLNSRPASAHRTRGGINP
jgi:hypothetical protein